MENLEPLRKRLTRWIKRTLRWMLILVFAYLGILVFGLIPVNNDFTPSNNGIELYVVSNPVHADVIVPVSTDVIDWFEAFAGFEFAGEISSETHVAFGWGDRGFYLETETWDDFKLSTAANALLLPSKSCVHVSFTRPEYYSEATRISVSHEQYKKLVDFINESFNTDDEGNRIQIEGYAYKSTDAFFDANGRYHLLNTCNSWVGRALQSSGVRVPWLSPLPKTPTIYVQSNTIER